MANYPNDSLSLSKLLYNGLNYICGPVMFDADPGSSFYLNVDPEIWDPTRHFTRVEISISFHLNCINGRAGPSVYPRRFSHQPYYFGSWSNSREENTRRFGYVRIRILISSPFMQIWIRQNSAVPTGSGSVKLSRSQSLC
jgi:hypothetical protein